MNWVLEWLLGLNRADFAGADGWSLRLAAMPASASALLALFALLGFLSWLTVRSYLREGAAPRRVKLVLSGLRLAAVILAFLVLLQPILVLRFSRTESGAVAVLVDDTLSMRWQDRYPDAAQRQALSRLLDAPEERLDGENRLSRAEAVQRALAREGGVLDRLAAEHPVLVSRFGVTGGETASYVQTLGEAEPGRRLSETALQALKGLKAEGRHTDLGRAVRETLNQLEGRRVSAVIVVSDGRNTGLETDRLAGAVQRARQRNIPLYAVAVGDPRPLRNAAVTQLLGPREARAGSKIAFTALLAHRGFPKTTIGVRLFRSVTGQEDWVETGAPVQATIGGDRPPPQAQTGELQEVTLTAEAPAVGIYSFKARIEPGREDSIADDNEAATAVRVTDQKMKVLLISRGASWEFQFLRNHLLRSTEHYAVTVWQQNADERFNQDASTGMKRTALPSTRQELTGYDVVVLCDPRHAPGSFDERFLELLDAFLGKHHGGVCYVAGIKSTGRDLAVRGALEPLAALLPVVLSADDGAGSRSAEERQAMALELTSEGQAHPVLRLASEAGESLAAWRRLPGVYRSQRVTKLKPLAVALAVRVEPGRGPREESEALIAAQYYGRGRVLYLGFDGTWRWRAMEDAAHYERFWSNAMEFLGAGRLEKSRILVTTAGGVFDAGADIPVRVEALNRDLNPLEAKGLVLELRPRDAGETRQFKARRERPGLYTGVVRAEQPGAYELSVKCDETGQADWTPQEVSSRVIQVRLPQAEFQQLEADHAALRELAGSDSRFALLHEIETLKVPSDRITVTREAPHTIWNTRLVLILFGVLLLTEWTLRKLYKMM